MLLRTCLSLLLLVIKGESYHADWSHAKPIDSAPSNRPTANTPQTYIVDIINRLGLKLLEIHNENNDNNIAISPYGALSVLVALIEGVNGEGTHEIYSATHLPYNLPYVRVGLRDIHRHLKSYFIPEEGFLAGLSLSHDNVTLTQEYEDILKFYGYDVDSFNNAFYPNFVTTQSSNETTSFDEITTENGSTTTDYITTSTMMSTTTENTMNDVGETSTEIFTTQTEGRTSRSETALPTTSEMITEVTSTESSTLPVPSSTTTTTETTTNTANEVPSTSTTTEPITSTTFTPTNPKTTRDVTTQTIRSTTPFQMSTLPNDGETTVMSTTLEPSSSTSTTMTITETEEPTTTEESQFELFNVTDSSIINNSSELKFGARIRALMSTATQSDNEIHKNRTVRSVLDYVIARYYDDHMVTQKPPPKFAGDELAFLVNGQYKVSNVNFMTYDTVLPFAYLAHLDALALKFPLDSSRYYLLLLLPVNKMGIDRLVCQLKFGPDLRNLASRALKPTHVRAVIPSFMLKGYVVLTPTLQKMGIWKVFEPRQADFSPMTRDRGIYVTNIEQAITVNIRNYVDPNTNNNFRYLHQYEPTHFKADHPFLYFVMDSDIHVALMAGKVINPLNSRIR